MTPEDRLIELLERANPVPDPNDAIVPTGGAYLRRLEKRSNVMTLSTIGPDRTDQQHSPEPDRRKPWLMAAVAAAVVAVVAGLVVVASRPDDDPVPAEQPTVPAPTTPTGEADPDGDATPAPDVENDADAGPPEASDPVETDPAPVRLPRLTTGTILEGGVTYRTSTAPDRGMNPEIEITIPGDQGEDRWEVLNGLPLEVDFLPIGDWAFGGREPTFGLAPVSEGVTVEEAVVSVQAFVDENGYELAVQQAEIGGEEVTMLRGRDTRASGDRLRIPTSENSGFIVPAGRQFVVYFIEGPTHVIAAKIESSEADLDAAIERVVPVLETIEFP